MTLLHQSRPGRHLMVLDDAETIARQARRRAAIRRRRRESLKAAGIGSLLIVVIALMFGAPALTVGVGWLVAVGFLAVAYSRLQDRQQLLRQRRNRARAGSGVGTPRPKGGFSTTRHRSGAPVWINDRAA